MQCLVSARFGMTAEVLRMGAEGATSVDVSDAGQWEVQQDPINFEIIRVWVPLVTDDGTGTPQRFTIDCEVRGIVDGGIRVAGTTERFGKEYENTDFAKMRFGPKVVLTKRDRITNIRNKRTKEIIWKEEELDMVGSDYRATVFNVNGVTPEPDAFQRVVSQFALLSRAPIQS